MAAFSVLLALSATTYSAITPGTSTAHFVITGLLLMSGTVIGRIWSYRVAMTSMPQLVSLFNALGGLSAVLLGLNAMHTLDNGPGHKAAGVVLILGVVLGGIAFTGGVAAYLKLDGRRMPVARRAHRLAARALLLVQWVCCCPSCCCRVPPCPSRPCCP